MKKLLFLLLILTTACTSGRKLVVTVENPSGYNRENEIVEVDWAKIKKKLKPKEEQSIIVLDEQNNQVISQQITKGESSINSLIFPVSLDAFSKNKFKIKTGELESFDPLVYGRLVPERRDDFTWENNQVAYRIYGPALQATGEISGGLDIWVKRTDALIINKWYKNDLAGIASYHADHGEGLDFYKVGPTLGLGMTAPLYEDKLILGKNFTDFEILDAGPLRFSFKVNYAPYLVNDNEVTETRIFTLDAYKLLNKLEKTFDSKSQSMQLATGLIMSGNDTQARKGDKNGIIAYEVPTSKVNGTIYTGAINLNGYEETKVVDKHFVGINHYESGSSYTYYVGGGWSKAGFDSFEQWYNYLSLEKDKLENPFIIQTK